MEAAICSEALWCFPNQPAISKKCQLRNSLVFHKRRPQTFRTTFTNRRRCACIKGAIGMFNFAAHASGDDSSEIFSETVEDGNPSSAGNGTFDEVITSLEDSRSRLKAVEKERDRLIEELAWAEAKQKEYADMINHDKELAIAELEAAKSLFNQKLQESVDDKFSLESQLVLAKKDAVELAVQVEKLAETAFQQATSRILQDASLRVSAAETLRLASCSMSC